jgi:hypothetical protein
MDYGLFADRFKPIQNFMDDNASLDGTMFETYGDELDYVKAQPDNKIWTYCDDGDNGYLSQGYHIVNRLGYVICANPWTDGDDEVHLYSEKDFD